MATERKIEVELKYQVAARGGADRYLVAPELGQFKAVGQVRSVRLDDGYVDSADWGLARAGFAARWRRTSGGTLISVKAQATSGARLQRREELEGPADAALPPLDWPASQARTIILELCGDEPLVELLTIRQLRRVRRLEAGDTRVELSLDEVEVLGNGSLLESFDELEVELKKGGEEPLEALADLLDTDEALRPVSGSKLDRAVLAMRAALPTMPESVRRRWQTAPPQLLNGKPKAVRPKDRPATESPAATTETDPAMPPGGEAEAAASEQDGPDSVSSEDRPEQVLRPTPHARRPGPRTLGIVADDSLPEAARKVLRFHFARMQNREAGARDGDDAEDLHDMRVAVRRMRAAWRVFDDAFKSSRTKRLRRRLESLSDKLGTVRDLDVLTQGLETYRKGLDPEQQPGLDPLLSLWARQRSSARKQLILELDSGGYSAFVHEMEEFLAAGSNAAASVPTPTIPHRVRDRAPSQIWGAYETVRAYELVLPWADIETIHELRIATKWLRYTLEFFGETLGPDGPRLLGRVAALQDFLGCLHDADVAAKLSRDVLVARAGELSRVETEAIGAYLHSRERELARRRRSLGPVWRAVNGAPFRRALGRAAAAL
ncbi:MAG: CYTH and CHAD domain-containing protein [Candidatus Limnocylindrales bacterium]